MGGDGQALTNNRALLNRSKQFDSDEKSHPTLPLEERSLICPLSLCTVDHPAAFDVGGIIYSKLSVVNHLLKKKSAGCEDIGIRKIADVREVANVVEDGVIKCPVTGYISSSRNHSFVGFWGCGHIVAEEALPASVKQENDFSDCPVCSLNSLVVPLFSSDVSQREKLHAILRSVRKRQREERST